MAVTVRSARPDELDAVGELTVRSYRHLLGDWLGGYAERLADAAGRAATCEVLVADDGGTLVGTVTFVPGPGLFGEMAEEGEAEVRMLAVDPAAQRRGVARLLVAACVERARAAGRHALVLSTTERMIGAQRLYETLGFRRVPERDRRVAERTPLLFYVLDL